VTGKVKLAVADGVAVISLNRPERRNAIDDDLHDELTGIWQRVLADPAAALARDRFRPGRGARDDQADC
jgi:enoyl-CoA hydratase/carnithine racemase